MSVRQRRDNEVKKLKMLKERARNGMWGKNERTALIESLINLTYLVYEKDLRQEESLEAHERIMDEMDWFDFND